MIVDRAGLIVYFDEDRRSDLIRKKIEGGYESFTEALSVDDWDIGQLNIALLSFSVSTLDYIAIAKRGGRVVTSKYRVEFSGMINLNTIPVSLIETKLDSKISNYFARASQGVGGVVPSDLWAALIKAIKAERPYLVEDIDRLLFMSGG